MITSVIFLLHFIFGFSTGFVGAIMPALIAAFELNMVQGSYILGMINAAGLVSVLVLFFLGDRLNKFLVIGVALLIFTLSLGTAASVPSYGFLLAVFFFFGLGIKTFDTMNNAVISDLHEQNRGLLLNLMHAGFSVGALLSPQFVLLLEESGRPWTSLFYFFCAGSLAAFVLYVIVVGFGRRQLRERRKQEPVNPSQPKSLSTVLEVAKSGKLWFLALVFFSVFGVISLVNTWLVYHFEVGIGSSRAIAKGAVTAFWIGVLLSRTVVAPVAIKLGSLRFIAASSVIAALLVGIALLAGDPYLILIGIFVTGLTSGQINPFVIANSCAIFPDRSAAVNALLFLIAYVSQIFFPWFSGLLGEAFNSTITMMVIPVSFLLVSFFTYLVIHMNRRSAQRAA